MPPLPNPANEIMKLKTDLAAARAAAEEKQKIHNEQMAAVRAAASQAALVTPNPRRALPTRSRSAAHSAALSRTWPRMCSISCTKTSSAAPAW